MPGADPITAIVAGLRRATRAVALVGGLVLLITVVLVVAEILLRRLAGTTVPGVHEVSGYGLALVATWSFAYALTEQAHVRIDLIQARLAAPLRAVLDVLALGTTAAVAIIVAYLAWPVLDRSISAGSTANTPLETPLWIPQSLWVAGWAWFALVASALFACAALALIQGRTGVVTAIAGAGDTDAPGEPADHAVNRDAPR